MPRSVRRNAAGDDQPDAAGCALAAARELNARIARVVYGCADPKAGAVDTLFTIGQDPRLNHRFTVARGVLGEACAGVLRSFFGALRARRKGAVPSAP